MRDDNDNDDVGDDESVDLLAFTHDVDALQSHDSLSICGRSCRHILR
jgi:hypothetical protein